MSDSESDDQKTLREFIDFFIGERLKPKLEEQEKLLAKADTPGKVEEITKKIESLETEYSRQEWLAAESKRARQLTLATHIPKFTHPMAKASMLYFNAEDCAERNFVGTHCVSETQNDVSGNAALLYIYAFLRQEYRGKTILALAEERSEELAKAMSDDINEAYGWIDGFLEIKEMESPSSHTLMKQVYFPLDDGGYHLLSPVFPTSLVQCVYEHIRDVRDSAAETRKARKDGIFSENGYREYRGTAITAYGGTKPQNVSYLNNSARHGENILLPSCPPNWNSKPVSPLKDKSVFKYKFGRRPHVMELLGYLEKLLKTSYKNADIRYGIEMKFDALSDELMDIYQEYQTLPPGWSRESGCRLNMSEKLWLDPPLQTDDEALIARYESGDWCDDVADGFAAWLSGVIEKISYDKRPPEEDVSLMLVKTAKKVLKDIKEANVYV